MPRLTQIAHLDFDVPMSTYLLPGTVIWCYPVLDRTVYKVWDYRLNHSISFSVFRSYKSEVCFILSKALKLASKSFVGR